MARRSKYSAISLTESEINYLKQISVSRTAMYQTVQRAKILLMNNDGINVSEITRRIDVNRKTVILCLDKCLNYGVSQALEDLPGRGRKAVITDDDKAYVINYACQKPKDLGYAQELWTHRLLAQHIQMHCVEEGHPILHNLSTSTMNSILNAASIKPHKVRYYLEKRDECFDEKMNDVLIVYKQLEIQFENGEDNAIETISYDEKPGIQAIANITPDLPVPPEHGFIARDHEYKRLGTLSLLAGMDLATGEIIPLVKDRHRSTEFIEFLKLLDNKYDKSRKIRIILDNHSIHSSKQTKAYLETVPDRFIFVFTPKHGSWLNLIEGFFSKFSRVCLRGIRVNSKQELEDRIYQYMNEVNDMPVRPRWKYRMDEIRV